MNLLVFIEILIHSLDKLYLFIKEYFLIGNHSDIFNQILKILEANKLFLILESIYYRSNSVFYATFGACKKAKNELPKVQTLFTVLAVTYEYLLYEIRFGLHNYVFRALFSKDFVVTTDQLVKALYTNRHPIDLRERVSKFNQLA